VGIASIAACAVTELAHITMTDGNADVITIAQQNLENAGLGSRRGGSGRASAHTFSWGASMCSSSSTGEAGLRLGGFDVVIGSELTYYNTDMALLVATVQGLLSDYTAGSSGSGEGGSGSGGGAVRAVSGLFIHAHIFRKEGQEEELIQCFAVVGWDSAEVRTGSSRMGQIELETETERAVACHCTTSLTSTVLPAFRSFECDVLRRGVYCTRPVHS
jgi:hypothetical protein